MTGFIESPPSYSSCVQMTLAQEPVQETQAEKLMMACERLGISNDQYEDLVQLASWKKVVICDDSTSMSWALELGGKKTRWDGLCETVQLLLPLFLCFDETGIRLEFLNRPDIAAVKTESDVANAFNAPPNGSTPLTETLEKVIQDSYKHGDKLLILIATDGEPNGSKSKFKKLIEERCGSSEKSIKNRQKNIRFGFLSCTTSKTEVAFLKELDGIPGVDITPAYEVALKEGKDPAHYTRATHVVKSLLGPISKKYDEMN